MSAPFRLDAGGRIDRHASCAFLSTARLTKASPATRSLPPCSPTACISSDVRSNITARAASWRRVPTNPMRSWRSGAGPRFTPNLRATQVELSDGLEAESQNHWPSLGRDFGALNDVFSPLFPAGFYYKTFMWPKSAWKRLYEPKIRAMAGLGRAPTLARCRPLRATLRSLRRAHHRGGSGRPRRRARGRSPWRARHLVRRAGGARRLAACRNESRDRRQGGLRLARRCRLDTDAFAERDDGCRAPRPSAISRTTCSASPSGSRTICRPRSRDARASGSGKCAPRKSCSRRARTNARSSFPTTTGPASCSPMRRASYLARYGVKPGSRAVVATAHDEAYRAAIELAAAGVEIAAIVDIRARGVGPLGRASARRRASHSRQRPRSAPRAAGKGVLGRDRARRPRRQGRRARASRLRPRADVRRLHAQRSISSRNRAASCASRRS